MTPEEHQHYQKLLSMVEEEIQRWRKRFKRCAMQSATVTIERLSLVATTPCFMQPMQFCLRKRFIAADIQVLLLLLDRSSPGLARLIANTTGCSLTPLTNAVRVIIALLPAYVTEETAITVLQHAEDFLKMTTTYLSSVLGENF